MIYSETYFELDSEEATHCHLICCVYIKGHVEMVNTKDQNNVFVYCVCYVVCRHCRYWCLWLLHNTVYRVRGSENSTLFCIQWPQILYMSILSTLGISISNAFNTIFVEAVNTKHIHIFLPIKFLIFNRFSICKKFWKAETEGFSTIPSNTIYVHTVDTRCKYF